MSLLAAERSFNEGLAALAEARHAQAAEHFRNAIEIEKSRNVPRRDMRYLSYYGLSMARAGRSSAAGLKACKDAVLREPHRPIFLLNLGRAHLECGEHDRAFACFKKGASLAPAHGPIRRELARLGRRLRAASPTLGPAHPAQRWVRQIRSRWRRRVPRWLALTRGRPAIL